jgi:3-isopropylmalate dehydrogenase
VAGLDILIIRELTGDIYFGQPRGRRTAVTATSRAPKKPSTPCATAARDRAHRPRRLPGRAQAQQEGDQRGQGQRAGDLPVLEGRGHRSARQYPDVELEHMYVDNAAMQLVKAPKAFDVVVTGNMFGDILSTKRPC